MSDTKTDEWETIRIRSPLKKTIEKVVDSKKDYGIPKFNSVADFVHSACVEKLELMGVKKKEVAS